MENFKLEELGCEELTQIEAVDTQGGLLDLSGLLDGLLGGILGGGEGNPVGGLLSTVTNLLNSLLGGLGGIVRPL
ncbi:MULTISPECIES: hypothetical protein [Chitinophaga]|uniref:Bacteriocin-like protein n=1 Tax=Chitinophaga caseinilytica TaxID=2267521 RepID=A0ABZ2Z4Z4_9BACT|nr:hypothetical protein [Chitinophaga rhizosphaerae]